MGRRSKRVSEAVERTGRAREAEPSRVSDAGAEVAVAQVMDPFDEVVAGDHVVVRGDGGLDRFRLERDQVSRRRLRWRRRIMVQPALRHRVELH